jgi:protease I
MGKLEGVRVAVLVEDLYENLELWYPVLRLREEGAQVFIVGPKAGETYKSKEGYPAKADKSAEEISADEIDAVIVPGGMLPIG